MRKNKAGEVGGDNKIEQAYLNVHQTRMLFQNVVPKLCYKMTPHDLNVAIMIELSLYHPPRGGKSIRKWHTGLFALMNSSVTDHPYIQVTLPSDWKNTNAAQCESNPNIKPFKLPQVGALYKLIRMHYLGRGQHITNTALFLHPYQDNRWRVCIHIIIPLLSLESYIYYIVNIYVASIPFMLQYHYAQMLRLIQKQVHDMVILILPLDIIIFNLFLIMLYLKQIISKMYIEKEQMQKVNQYGDIIIYLDHFVKVLLHYMVLQD